MTAAERKRWLGRLKHDLVKPIVWLARDLVDVPIDELDRPDGRARVREALRAALALRDREGNPATPSEVWRAYREEIEPALALPERGALDMFERVVAQAQEAAREGG